VLAQAALAYARFVDEEKRAEEVDGVLDLKPKRERKQSGKITRWTEAEEAPGVWGGAPGTSGGAPGTHLGA